MNTIQLTKGLVAIVDEELWSWLNSFSWYASGVKGKEYAARRLRQDEDDIPRLIYLHHQVLDIKPWELIGIHIDHKDGNRLDCRRGNLIITTPARNAQNAVLAKTQKGIGYDSTHNRYKAYVNIPKPQGTTRINIGTYKTYEEAYAARQIKVRELVLSGELSG